MSCLGRRTRRRQHWALLCHVSECRRGTHQGDIGCPSYSKWTLYARVPCPGQPRRVSATGAAEAKKGGDRRRTGVPLGRVVTRLRSNPSGHTDTYTQGDMLGTAVCRRGEQGSRGARHSRACAPMALPSWTSLLRRFVSGWSSDASGGIRPPGGRRSANSDTKRCFCRLAAPVDGQCIAPSHSRSGSRCWPTGCAW